MRILKAAFLFWFIAEMMDVISTFSVLHFIPGAREANGLMLAGDHISIWHMMFLKSWNILAMCIVVKLIDWGLEGKNRLLASLPIWYAAWNLWQVVISNVSGFALLLK